MIITNTDILLVFVDVLYRCSTSFTAKHRRERGAQYEHILMSGHSEIRNLFNFIPEVSCYMV